MHSVLPEKIDLEDTMKRKKPKKQKKQNYTKTEWVLCSEDWRDIVIMYIPELNDKPIEDNYADMSWDEIKKAYKEYKRRTQMKRAK